MARTKKTMGRKSTGGDTSDAADANPRPPSSSPSHPKMQAPEPASEVLPPVSVLVATPGYRGHTGFKTSFKLTDPISQLRTAVFDRTQLPASEQRLVAQGKELQDSQTVADIPAVGKEGRRVTCTPKHSRWPGQRASDAPSLRGLDGFYPEHVPEEENAGVGEDDPVDELPWSLEPPPSWRKLSDGGLPPPAAPFAPEQLAAGDKLRAKGNAAYRALDVQGLAAPIWLGRHAAVVTLYHEALAASVCDEQKAFCYKNLGAAHLKLSDRVFAGVSTHDALGALAKAASAFGTAVQLGKSCSAAWSLDVAERFQAVLSRLTQESCLACRMKLLVRIGDALPSPPRACDYYAAEILTSVADALANLRDEIEDDDDLPANSEPAIAAVESCRREAVLRARAIAPLVLPEEGGDEEDEEDESTVWSFIGDQWHGMATAILAGERLCVNLGMSLQVRLGFLEALERELHLDTQPDVFASARGHLALAASTACLKAATVSAEAENYKRGISECEVGISAIARGLIHERKVASSTHGSEGATRSLSDGLRVELEDTRELLRIAYGSIQSVQARCEADKRLKDYMGDAVDAIDYEYVREICDGYLVAASLAAELENEAAAYARLGNAYLRVLIGHADARARAEMYYLKADDLCGLLAVAPTRRSWYVDLKAALQRFAETAEKRVADGEAIWAAADKGPAALLMHAYTTHPPPVHRGDNNTTPAWLMQVASADAGSLKKMMKQAMTDFHPDKVRGGASRVDASWADIMDEVSKAFNTVWDKRFKKQK